MRGFSPERVLQNLLLKYFYQQANDALLHFALGAIRCSKTLSSMLAELGCDLTIVSGHL
jgi:hypothetical protein